MYTLRIVEKTKDPTTGKYDEVVENFSIGNSYSLLMKDKTKEFETCINNLYPGEDIAKVYGLVCGDNDQCIFLFKDDTDDNKYSYYIMTENGETFECL